MQLQLPEITNGNIINYVDLTNRVMELFYSGLGGIRQTKNSIGFQHIDIRPESVGDVTNAEASYLSPYGKITVDWNENNKGFELKTEIPVNTTATIFLPIKEAAKITESGKAVFNSKDVKFLKNEDGRALFEVGSGLYKFKVSYK